MSWNDEQRLAKRGEYARLYAGGHGKNGRPVVVPENVERRDVHEPCWQCGQARGCKHRGAE